MRTVIATDSETAWPGILARIRDKSARKSDEHDDLTREFFSWIKARDNQSGRRRRAERINSRLWIKRVLGRAGLAARIEADENTSSPADEGFTGRA